MAQPEELYYTKEHEWVRFEGDNTAVIGITDYAIEQLGDVVYLELPDEGAEFEQGDSFGTVESTKTVSDLYCPLEGKVTVANTSLSDNLEDLMEDPFEKGWLVKLAYSKKELDDLMSRSEYDKFIADES